MQQRGAKLLSHVPRDLIVANEHGIDAMAFSDRNPECAVINFSSMNIGKFERWSWFYRRRLRRPAVYMFLRDDECHYYLGKGGHLAPRFLDTITSVLQQHDISRSEVVTIGSSMGGYAAVYFAHVLEAKAAIAINPQVETESAKLHEFSNWTRQMKEVGAGWVDLDDFVRDHPHRPMVYLRAGRYAADQAAGDKLSAALLAEGKTLVRDYDSSTRHGWGELSPSGLYKLIEGYLGRSRSPAIRARLQLLDVLRGMGVPSL